MTQNKDKLIRIRKNDVRRFISFNGVWNGFVKMSDNKIHCATLTNFASLQNKDILEFYKLVL